jgi:hypothetical protein
MIGGNKIADVKKWLINIEGVDVSDAVLSVNVHQDIFAPCTTAIFRFNDTNNLLMNLPIRAGLRIAFAYQTETGSEVGDGNKQWNFVIHKIADKEMTGQQQQTYSVYAVDRTFLANEVQRVRKAYKNTKVSEIASSIISEKLNRQVDVHPTDNNMSIVVPAWTPYDTLAWLTKVAMKDKAADYIFFMQHDGKFAFKSFEQLYSSSSESCKIRFQIAPNSITNQTGEPIHDRTTFIEQYQFEHFDALMNLKSGYYKNKLFTYDVLTKKWEEKVFTFGDDNAADKKVQPVDEFMSGTEDVTFGFLPKHTQMNTTANYLDTSTDWFGSRKSSIQKFEQEKLLFQVPGSAKSCEWFGKNCVVDLPSQDEQSGERFDKHRRGNYLITAMTHMVGREAYMVNIEGVKKRLEVAA